MSKMLIVGDRAERLVEAILAALDQECFGHVPHSDFELKIVDTERGLEVTIDAVVTALFP